MTPAIPGIHDDYRPTSEELEARIGHLFLRSSSVRITVLQAIQLCDRLADTVTAARGLR